MRRCSTPLTPLRAAGTPVNVHEATQGPWRTWRIAQRRHEDYTNVRYYALSTGAAPSSNTLVMDRMSALPTCWTFDRRWTRDRHEVRPQGRHRSRWMPRRGQLACREPPVPQLRYASGEAYHKGTSVRVFLRVSSGDVARAEAQWAARIPPTSHMQLGHSVNGWPHETRVIDVAYLFRASSRPTSGRCSTAWDSMTRASWLYLGRIHWVGRKR